MKYMVGVSCHREPELSGSRRFPRENTYPRLLQRGRGGKSLVLSHQLARLAININATERRAPKESIDFGWFGRRKEEDEKKKDELKAFVKP